MMENNVLWGIIAVCALVLGLLAGIFWIIPEAECPTCPDCTCPELVCNPAIVEETVYIDCHDDLEQVEEDMDLYEEETGIRVYRYQTTRECSDFLEKGFYQDDREIVGYADDDGDCVVFYTKK